MTAQNRLANFGFMLTEEGISSEDHSKLQSLGIELESLYSKSLAQARAIDANDEYTSAGKLRQKRKLTDEIAQDLGKYDKLVHKEMEMIGNQQSWALELRKLKEGMHTSTQPKADPVLTFLQQQEIRNYLRSIKEPIKIEAAIRVQAEQGNYQFLDAVKNAPEGSQHFILDKTREILESKRLQAMNPMASARIAQIERAQRTLAGMVGSLKQSLNKAGLFEEPERPIQFMNQAS